MREQKSSFDRQPTGPDPVPAYPHQRKPSCCGNALEAIHRGKHRQASRQFGLLVECLVFDDKREENLKEKLAEERKEKAAYAKKVGQLTMQVDWLKKKSEEICGPDYESKFSPKPFDD